MESLDNFINDHSALVNGGNIQAAVNFSGQTLARYFENLRLEAKGGHDINDLAAQALVVASAHCHDLIAADESEQAFATMVMAILTVFTARADIDKLHGIYLSALSDALVMADQAANTAQTKNDSFALDHLEQCRSLLAAVFAAAFDHCPQQELLPLRRHIDQLSTFPGTVAQEFNGTKISHILAIDILYDIASRLAACGYI